MAVPQNGWCMMENPVNMDTLGVRLFQETSISSHDYYTTTIMNDSQEMSRV